MGHGYNFNVQKRDKGYVIIAKDYGVVIRSNDLISGIKELEHRVDDVISQLREAGIEPEQIETGRDKKDFWPELWLFFIKLTFIALLFGGIFVMVAAPFENKLSRVIERTSFVGFAIEHPAQFVIRFADTIDKISPARLQEYKLAIRKIVAKIAPLVDEVRSTTTESESRGTTSARIRYWARFTSADEGRDGTPQSRRQ